MSAFRPDLVDVWIFRVDAVHGVEILLMRRAPGRILAGLWQGVSGSLETGERIVAGALRELVEEPGLRPADVEAFYDLDQVNQFHVAPMDAVVTAAVFATRLKPGVEPRLSHEHDALECGTLCTRRDVIGGSRRTGVAKSPDRAGRLHVSRRRSQP